MTVSRDRTVLLGAGVLAAAVVVVGLLVGGPRLGTATPPFVASWAPLLDIAWALAAAATLGTLVAVAPALLRAPTGLFLLAVSGLALAAALTLNAARSGTRGWSAIFDLAPGGSFEAKNEYLPGLPMLRDGVHVFLDRFAETVPTAPINVGGHPPGLLLVLHALGITTAGGMAALCIACAVAVVPLTWWLCRTLHADPRTARLGACMAAASPGLLLFGTTSADAVFAAAGLLAAALLAQRAPAARAVGALVLAAGAFGSWALLSAGAFAVLLVWRRDGLRAAARLAVLCAVPFLVLNAVLAAAAGYDPIGTFHATEDYYRRSLARVRPYWFWSLGSPTAWAVSTGVPIAGAWLVAARRADPAAVALLVVVVTASVLGFTKAEVERIWLPFVPLACTGAAAALPARWLRPALAALAAQALATQLLFQTIW